MLRTGLTYLKIGVNGGLCKGGNEPPDSLKIRYLVIKKLVMTNSSNTSQKVHFTFL